MSKQWKNVRWADVGSDASVQLIEHPVLNTLMSKDVFSAEFHAVLTQLDASCMANCVDFFFQRDFLDNSVLRFVGDTEKLDFFEWAEEEGCCPSLKRIHDGTHTMSLTPQQSQCYNEPTREEIERELDRFRARLKAEEQQKVKQQKGKQKKPKKAVSLQQQLVSRRKAIQQLKEKINRANGAKKVKLGRKLEKALEALSKLRVSQ
ncbi:hypothetical protein OAM67_01540 [bacterium]|nr:hypothetical protein [bacterium]